MTDIGREKAELRRRMRMMRGQIDDLTRKRESEKICWWLEHSKDLDLASARLVGMYWPMPWEVDLRPLMGRLRQRGVGIALPCFDAEGEVYRAALAPADTKLLCAGKQGILEPTAPEWVLNKEIDFWLVPGLAFDWNGNRLGHGGGWFDRILESARKACLCGIAYSWEMVDSVPGERHDIQMEWMATNRGVFRALRLLGGGRL